MKEFLNIGYAAAVFAGIVLVVFAGVLLCRRFRKYARTKERDDMDGFDFEYYCADLLVADGFIDVQVTRSSGDYGVDILAEKDGVTYAIQCKRYSGLVGVKAVQEKAGGAGLVPKADKRCTGCGLCAKNCPAQAISKANLKTADSKKCISCMRCVTECPESARKVNEAMVSIAALAMKKACSERKSNELYI